MPHSPIPDNSFILTEFSDFRISRRGRSADKYKLVVGGDELNTVWFNDRPLRRWGNFGFDKITGKTEWNRLFGGVNPNSILTGKGKSLAFETGHFSVEDEGKIVSRIRILDGKKSQDVVTGRWNNSSLLIDSTSEVSTDNIVEGLSGLLVVGSALVLYQRIRNNNLADTLEREINNTSADIAQARQRVSAAQEAFDKASEKVADLGFAKEDALAAIDKYEKASALRAERLAETENDIAQLLEEYGKRTIDEFINDPAIPADERSAMFNLYDQSLNDTSRLDRIRTAIQELEQTVDELNGEIADAENTAAPLRAALEQEVSDLDTLEQTLSAQQELLSQARQNLAATLDEQIASENLFDNPAIRQAEEQINAGDIDESALIQQMIENSNRAFVEDGINGVGRALGQELSSASRSGLESLIESVNANTLESYTILSCGSAICESIQEVDKITDLYSEEFIIDRSEIFEDSNVFSALRQDLADVGYEDEIGELVEYASSSEFAEESGPLIEALTEGTLAAEDALSVIDVASIGLGGDAVVGGLVAQSGGEFLLGEVAIDILEIAALAL